MLKLKFVTILKLNAEEKILQSEISEELDEISGENKGEAPCNCLPSCTTISYKATLITNENVVENNSFSLELFFTESEFTVSNRTERYGWTDFIAGCGGILGENYLISSFKLFFLS
jgi:Amiloride-sensitive sodium channel